MTDENITDHPSCVYEGWVRHRRFLPFDHQFRYRIFLMYVDLDQLDKTFKNFWFWSSNRFNLAWFRRKDHFGPSAQPLSDTVRDFVEEKSGLRPSGPIRLMTHFRYFGYLINPVSFFFCYSPDGKLESMVAEVTNTPWGETHCYHVDLSQATKGLKTEKEFHVSPFLPMDTSYRWALREPGEKFDIHIDNFRDGARMMDVTMSMERRELNSRNLRKGLLAYPMMTMQVAARIYWQALKLKLKGARFYPHPKHDNHSTAQSRSENHSNSEKSGLSSIEQLGR